MDGGKWRVEFVEVGKSSSLEELVAQLTVQQKVQLVRQIRRLEEHGHGLGSEYFKKVSGTDLWEFRVRVQDGTLRIFYRLVDRTYWMLYGFKKTSKKLRKTDIKTAEARWKDLEAKL